MKQAPEIMIVAGEVSGDMYAARLVSAIARRRPDIHFFGIGGDAMAAAGVEILHDAKNMAVMGFTEVLARFSFFRRIFLNMIDVAVRRRPMAVILVDYPGFNLRLAAQTHAMGLKTIYYISPQVWAWHRSRIPTMARIIDRLISIFPFEKACFEGTPLRVDFAGHPLVDETLKSLSEPLDEIPWSGVPRIAMLPGSRAVEIARILPTMWQTAAILEVMYPTAGFVLACPSPSVEAIVRKTLAGLRGGPLRWTIVTGRTRQVLRQARAAMVASGTATIETALMSCPMVVIYRLSALTHFMAKRLVRIKHIGMVNIVAGKEVCPELIQNQAKPERIARRMVPLLEDMPERSRMLQEFERVREALGPGGAYDRAAASVLDEIDSDQMSTTSLARSA